MSALKGSYDLLRLYWAHERRTYPFMLVNAVVTPATAAYIGTRFRLESEGMVQFWMAGCLTMGLGMTGISQVGFAILNDRFKGRLRLLTCLPLSRFSYFSAHITLAALEGMALVLAGFVLFWMVGVAEVERSSLGHAALCGAVAGISIGSLGGFLALRFPTFDAGNAAVTIAAVALAGSSPVFYELESLPRVAREVAMLSPFTHVAPLLRALLAGQPLPAGALLGGAIVAALFITLGTRAMRWRA